MSPPATVVDASVAIKWVRLETHSTWARTLLDPGRVLLAPEMLAAECGNAFWRLHRQREAGMPHPDMLLDRLLDVPMTRVRMDEASVRSALRLAMRLDHPIYDCFYLALTLDREAALATADTRFAAAIRRCGMLPDERLLTPPAAG